MLPPVGPIGLSVNSAMKSANTLPLIAVLGSYSMWNRLSSTDHFSIMPDMSNRRREAFIKVEVNTMIG